MLQKACIEIDDPVINSAGGNPEQIEVQFNPTEYTLAKGAQISEIAINGLDSPILQFVRGTNEKLTLDLFFDTAGEDGADVRTQTNKVYKLVKINPKSHAPPRIRFHWGGGISFKAVVESIQQKFNLFSPSGIPLRATLSVTFREYKTLKQQLEELKLQSSDHTKRRIVNQGDTLVQIAAQEYGNPAQWKVIAEKNSIEDPLFLRPGLELLIPPTV